MTARAVYKNCVRKCSLPLRYGPGFLSLNRLTPNLWTRWLHRRSPSRANFRYRHRPVSFSRFSIITSKRRTFQRFRDVIQNFGGAHIWSECASAFRVWMGHRNRNRSYLRCNPIIPPEPCIHADQASSAWQRSGRVRGWLQIGGISDTHPVAHIRKSSPFSSPIPIPIPPPNKNPF